MIERDQSFAGSVAWVFSAGLWLFGCGSSSAAVEAPGIAGGNGNGPAAAGASGSGAVELGGTTSGGAGPGAAGAGPGAGGLGSDGAGVGGTTASAGATAESAGAGGSPPSTAGASGAGPTAGGGGVPDPNQRRLLLRDEGNSAVHYVDLARPANHWSVVVPTGRELQLVGNRHFLIGTDSGYEERSLDDGHLLSAVTSFAGTQTAHRLHNGHTLLAGVDFNGGQGIVLVEVDAQGKVQKQIAYAGFTYVRGVRETKNGHYLVAADKQVFEGDASGTVVWNVTIDGPAAPHTWQALPLASGEVVVAAGYSANLQIFPVAKSPVRVITGGTGVKPFFFAGLQVLANGNFIVANWQGHGAGLGASGLQVLEYAPGGQLVWSWHQDATFVSSLQGVVVLDGLDLNALQVESATSGILESAP